MLYYNITLCMFIVCVNIYIYIYIYIYNAYHLAPWPRSTTVHSPSSPRGGSLRERVVDGGRGLNMRRGSGNSSVNTRQL